MNKFFLTSFIIGFALNLQAQRNVILIIADDLGTDYFGFYENHVDTVDVPNIRALMQKGVRFKNAMSNPVCSATRSTALTGRYGFRTGVGAIVGGPGGSGQIDTSEKTIPKLLKNYNSQIATANIGKWHLSQATPASNLLNPNVLGYDHFEGPFIGAIPSFTNWTKYTNGVSSNCTNYATSENVNNAVAWLKSLNSSHPFFLWMAFNAPHEPIHLPPAGLHSYTTLTGTTADINANPKSYFKAMTQALDTEIGRLFDSLQVLNKLDSTDIIFIGDNGNTTKTAQNVNPAKSKGTVYEYGVHVPMIITGPSVVNPNRSSDALVNTSDIFSTVLEMMGHSNWISQIPISKPVDSKSIMPVLNNTNTVIRPWSFCEFFKVMHDSTEAKAMRNADYKLIKYDYGKEEFYNLSLDPQESNDLLLTTLTSNDISNYYYLCNEMTQLVGVGNFCQIGVGLQDNEIANLNLITYPNPFQTQIHISERYRNHEFELINLYGQIIYSGSRIENQNFSNLSNGIYFLKDKQTQQIIKVRKEN